MNEKDGVEKCALSFIGLCSLRFCATYRAVFVCCPE